MRAFSMRRRRRSIAATQCLSLAAEAAPWRGNGWTTAWARPMATRPQSAPGTVRPLTAELYRFIARGLIRRVDVMFVRHPQGGTATIEQRQLLPINPASFVSSRAGPPPLHNLAPDLLIEKLVADYVFAVLTEAVVESLAGENAARLAAMGSAYDNVSKKLEELRQDARLARQDEITTELLDLVTGAEASHGTDRPLHRLKRARRTTR